MPALSKTEYLKQLDGLAGEIQRQFLDAVRRRVAKVNTLDLEDAIASGDIDR